MDPQYLEHDIMYFICDNWLWICIVFIIVSCIIGFADGYIAGKKDK